ncbi:MAG: response regulator transcription factor [Polyangiaceae bacterium]|nr:response regulator transcription factor [Polyangiaceae bacterium]
MARRSFILIVGHGPELERDEGAAQTLRGLGANVRTLEMWEEPSRILRDDDDDVRAVLIETPERPDLAVALLRAVRRDQRLQGTPAIAAVSVPHVSRLDPAGGFDDFVLVPYVPAELYARIRKAEWQRSEFATEERVKIGPLVIDRSAHEACIDGRPVSLTAKEFALLSYLCERRGKVVSRDELLRRVWGNRYEGGPRTVDIHVTRLRTKFGSALPLATLRGAGYKLETPGSVTEEDTGEDGDDQGLSAERKRATGFLSA